MIIASILTFVSLVILFAGAEGLIRGSSSIATRAGVSPLIVGLTIVAFGTSSPELIVSLKATLASQGDIALGNILGSNSFNIGVILGLTALICPIPVHLQIIKFDAPAALFVALLLSLLLIDGSISRLDGVFLLGLLVAYTAVNLRVAKREAKDSSVITNKSTRHWGIDLGLIFGGLGLLFVGSNLLMDNVIFIARNFGISEALIGLTIVACGTSLPELVTSILAAIRKQSDIAVGNVIGSNIFNILGILGCCGLVAPVQFLGIRPLDFIMVIVFTSLLLPLIHTNKRLIRIEGTILLTIYGGYLWVLWQKS